MDVEPINNLPSSTVVEKSYLFFILVIPVVFVDIFPVFVVISESLLVICVCSPALKSWKVIFFVAFPTESYNNMRSPEFGDVYAVSLLIS